MVCIELSPSVAQLWDGLRGFLNSAFVSAALSALAGAGLGVWGAQRVTEKSARRKELLTALRQANAITVLAATVANQALSVKSQHIAQMRATYLADRKSASELNDLLLSGGQPTEEPKFHFQLMKVTPVNAPIEPLKNLIYSADLMPGKAIAIVSAVEQAGIELGHVIDLRNGLIEGFMSAKMPDELYLQTYFGLKRRDGNTDSTFHDAVVAMSQYVDDLAFFAGELASAMQAHATRVREQLIRLEKVPPKVTKVDFSEAEASKLMPPRTEYRAWLAGFEEQSP